MDNKDVSPFKVHHFSAREDMEEIHFQIIQLEGSFMIWIGNSSKHFDNLAMSVMTKYEKAPISVNMIGDNSDFTSQILAKKLVTKTGKQVYVSYNLPENEKIEKFVEHQLFEKLKSDQNILN